MKRGGGGGGRRELPLFPSVSVRYQEKHVWQDLGMKRGSMERGGHGRGESKKD